MNLDATPRRSHSRGDAVVRKKRGKSAGGQRLTTCSIRNADSKSRLPDNRPWPHQSHVPTRTLYDIMLFHNTFGDDPDSVSLLTVSHSSVAK